MSYIYCDSSRSGNHLFLLSGHDVPCLHCGLTLADLRQEALL